MDNTYRICLSGLLCTVLLWTGCKEEYVTPESAPFPYFPVREGLYRIYDVDSVVHAENDNNNDDSVYTYNFQVMEVIDSSYIDAVGDTSQMVVRYRRTDTSSAWSLMSVWTQKLIASGAYTTEENVVYHKLAVPADLQTVWDANAGNILEEEPCYYLSLDQPYTLGALAFDSVASVFQRDDDNFVERKYGREVYAAGIGLVFKSRVDLGKRNGLVVSGLDYRMSLAEWGNR
jgi:hypothetical protein